MEQHGYCLDLASRPETSPSQAVSTRTLPSNQQDDMSPPDALVQGLNDRIQELEQKLSNILSVQPSTDPGLSAKTGPDHPSINGTFAKTRFFGQSHRSICLKQFREFMMLFFRWETDEHSDVHNIMGRCKRLARIAKAQIILRGPVCSDPRDYVPPRIVSDQLVEAYLRTMESVYRVMHVPSFRRAYEQYWVNPAASNPAFVMNLLLILAIGSVFCSDGTPHGSLIPRLSVSQWIYTAQSWLSSPFEKARLDIAGLQLQCLLLIARQVTAVGSELVWVAAGSLLRTAMHMGVHIDPRHMAQISPFDAEIRRRLWATILEINLQTSMDAGGTPLIHADDYDCALPMNLNDDELEQIPFPSARPPTETTQSTLQIALGRSHTARIKVAHFTNSFRSAMSYDEALALSAELAETYHANAAINHPTPAPSTNTTRITPFHHKLYSLMTQRFLMSLHMPFALRAPTNPKYYYSRQVNFKTALRILTALESCLPSPSQPSNPTQTQAPDPDSHRLRLIGAASFRDVPAIAISNIFFELDLQLDDDRHTDILSTTLHHQDVAVEPFRYATLRASLERYIGLAADRIRAGETNVKGYVMCASFMAHLDAKHRGVPEEAVIYEALRVTLTNAAEILQGLVDGLKGEDDSVIERGSAVGLGGLVDGDGAGLVSPDAQEGWLFGEEMEPWVNLGMDVDMDAWLAAQGILGGGA
ncbi:fungal specific transcription factor domain-containing protein [Aspergillus homomorphus CBS 101889]|uniref:Xylanolytic transcriptional activator regulatory domain-containing protein n=1 Tax=Aspergillus homomorphus (strain CBS 101889) TaxID=1450537 RepID=A0A395HJY7_ASPHC|nr:hypothetical protein BO97DRAFT_398569 [Aspergillus homomorphus CBS 101889]RAL08252.1 hypothetical protein BO97DRAFT_398569 [Aspergillus homomorphus CBS 101889]